MSKQNLTRALTRAHALLDCVQDLVATATTSGAITSLNRAGAALLGLDGTPVEDLQLADLHPPATAQTLVAELFDHARSHGSWSGELTMLHRDGAKIPVAYQLVFVPGDGGPPELGIIARDLTGAKLAESAEVRLLRELQQLKTVIDSTSDFVAMASFEGQITFVNPAGLAMCGRQDQDLHALSVADFQPRADVDKLTT
ncbi:MAG: PAS domain-containing protein, partial [Nannocystaceae bacterium]